MSATWQVAVVALAVLAAVCAYGELVLARTVGGIRQQLASATPVDGGDVRIRLRLSAEHPTLVVFLTDTCAACEGIVPALNELQIELEREEVPLSGHALVAGEREAFIHRTRLLLPTLPGDREIYRDMGVSATPESVLYAPDGEVIHRDHPLNVDQLDSFLRVAVGYPVLSSPDAVPNAANGRRSGDPSAVQSTLEGGSEPQGGRST